MSVPVNRNLWVDYLRSALTVLVVAHHSSLAYTTFAEFNKNAYILSTHAIVDAKRWVGLDIFENFNDIFFMSLMFLIGGLFLSRSLEKKGAWSFIRDRVYRLFIPFLLGGTSLMLLAYFPSFYVAHESTDIVAYVKDFFYVENYPVGPPWFLWVLFVFNLIFVAVHFTLKNSLSVAGKKLSVFHKLPLSFFILFLALTWILYVPVAYNIGAGTWTGFGQFDFQVSRVLLYFGYFMFGVVIGNDNFSKGIFSSEGILVRGWWIWALLALTIYVVLIIVGSSLPQMVKDQRISELSAWMIYYTLYVSSCVLSCVTFITVFRKFANTEIRWWKSLSDNAYLIYLIHFVFVTWLQFSLLTLDLSALVKFLITFTASFVLSWATSSILRNIKFIRTWL